VRKFTPERKTRGALYASSRARGPNVFENDASRLACVPNLLSKVGVILLGIAFSEKPVDSMQISREASAEAIEVAFWRIRHVV
jgi:hypothetical protein